jgi:hypothetical protein
LVDLFGAAAVAAASDLVAIARGASICLGGVVEEVETLETGVGTGADR